MKIVDQIKNSKALRQSAFVMVGNTFASGIAAIALIIFSRFLGPEKFGIFSIGFSTVMLLSRLSDFGVNIALQKFIAQSFEKSTKNAKNIITTSLGIKTIISLLILTAFYILAKPISTHWLKTSHIQIVKIAIILTIPTILFEYVATIHQSTRQFVHSVVMSISQATMKAIFAIAILFMQIKDPITAFILYVSSPLVGVVYGLWKLPKWAKLRWQKTDKSSKKKIISILKFTSIAVAAGAIGDNIDVLIVKSYLTEYDTGLYSAGSRLAILISMLGYSLGTVLNPRVARYKNAKHFSAYVKKATLISIAALVSILFIAPIAKPLIILTAGKEYIAATQAVRFLLSAGLVTVATTPFVSMFYVLEKPSYFAISGIVQTVTLIVANVILIPQVGIVGAGQAKLIMRVITFVFTIIFANFAIRQAHKKGISELVRSHED